jgi:hypothetical protein
MRLLRSCRYDCEQKDLVDEENCGLRIEDCGSRMEDGGSKIAALCARRFSIFNLQSSIFVYFGIRVSLRAVGGRRTG